MLEITVEKNDTVPCPKMLRDMKKCHFDSLWLIEPNLAIAYLAIIYLSSVKSLHTFVPQNNKNVHLGFYPYQYYSQCDSEKFKKCQ